jgi:hypothetical protein
MTFLRSIFHKSVLADHFLNCLAPLQGARNYPMPSGGLRCAPTTGYFLSALRAAD